VVVLAFVFLELVMDLVLSVELLVLLFPCSYILSVGEIKMHLLMVSGRGGSCYFGGEGVNITFVFTAVRSRVESFDRLFFQHLGNIQKFLMVSLCQRWPFGGLLINLGRCKDL